MLYFAIVLFAIAAVLGLMILLKWLSKHDAPNSVVYSHGIIAAIALVLIIVYAFQNPTNYPQLSIILFVVGALGGIYLFITHLKSKARPLGIAFVHALIAVAAFVTLLIFAFV